MRILDGKGLLWIGIGALALALFLMYAVIQCQAPQKIEDVTEETTQTKKEPPPQVYEETALPDSGGMKF